MNNTSLLVSDQLLLRPEEAAEYLAIGRTQVYNLVRTGELSSVKIGRLRRIPRSACDQYVELLRASGSS